eukprot:2692837-Rhodomonas_salina.1
MARHACSYATLREYWSCLRHAPTQSRLTRAPTPHVSHALAHATSRTHIQLQSADLFVEGGEVGDVGGVVEELGVGGLEVVDQHPELRAPVAGVVDP